MELLRRNPLAPVPARRLCMALCLLLTAALTFTPDAAAAPFMARKRAGAYVVTIAINRNPPVMGTNDISVQIRDGAGRTLTGASVSVNYSMPPMPGMVPMNYTTRAVARGGGYVARMNFIMVGPWNIAVSFRAGAASGRIVVPIDVR